MLSAPVLGELLVRSSRDVNVRFAVDCARRVLCMVEDAPLEVQAARQVLSLCDLWLAHRDDGFERHCGNSAYNLSTRIDQWVPQPSAAWYALESCRLAGACVQEANAFESAFLASERAVSCVRYGASGGRVVDGPGDAEREWQSGRLAELIWPGLNEVERATAVMVAHEAIVPVDEAGALALALCAGAA